MRESYYHKLKWGIKWETISCCFFFHVPLPIGRLASVKKASKSRFGSVGYWNELVKATRNCSMCRKSRMWRKKSNVLLARTCISCARSRCQRKAGMREKARMTIRASNEREISFTLVRYSSSRAYGTTAVSLPREKSVFTKVQRILTEFLTF